MRLAVVLVAVHQRSSFEASPVDTEWLLVLLSTYDIELFVDQATAGSELLRQMEVPVSVSIKRSVEGGDGRRISADALQARAVRQAHEQSPPFDVIIYGSDVTVDFAWFEPGLRSIPRGVALGGGIAHGRRAVWEDRHLFAAMARRMWSWTGLVTSADFLLSDVPSAAFGLRDNGLLPPRYTLDGRQPRPVADFSSTAESRLAVAATSLGARGLESLVQRLIKRFPPQGALTYLIAIRPPLPSEGISLEKTLLGRCPEDLRRRIVVAPTGDDGVASDFFAAADIVVVASLAELTVPGIATAARRRGWTLLDEAAALTEAARGPSAVGVFLNPLLPPVQAPPVHVPPAGHGDKTVQVLTWESPSTKFRRILEDVSQDLGEDDFLVIHAEGRIGPATRLFSWDRLHGVDLVVWGRPDTMLDSPDPNWLYPFAVAVRGACVPAVAEAVSDCESIWDLICWAASYEWIDRLRLLVLPASADIECWEVVEVNHVDTVWSPDCGVLPAPKWI